MRHRGKNIKYVYRGQEFKSRAALARFANIPESTLRDRLENYKEQFPTLELAIETPVGLHKTRAREGKAESSPPKPDWYDMLETFNPLWQQHQFIPNLNSRRGMYG